MATNAVVCTQFHLLLGNHFNLILDSFILPASSDAAAAAATLCSPNLLMWKRLRPHTSADTPILRGYNFTAWAAKQQVELALRSECSVSSPKRQCLNSTLFFKVQYTKPCSATTTTRRHKHTTGCRYNSRIRSLTSPRPLNCSSRGSSLLSIKFSSKR